MPIRASLPEGTLESLSQAETRLFQLGREVSKFAKERKDLLALAETGQVINSSLELDEVLRIVMDTIVRLTGAERGFLMLRDDNGEMVTRIARNWEQESLRADETAISRTIIQRVIDTGEPVMTTNAQEDARFGGTESIVAYALRSILCTPLKVKNDLIGVIYTDNRIRAGTFSDSERDLLAAFANQAAVAIDNARLFARLRRTLSEVTELKNLMDNVFASIASGVITANVYDQITLVNRAAESILGQGMTDIIGRPLDEVFPSIVDSLYPQLLAIRQSNAPAADVEVSHTLPERGNVDWRFVVSPLKDADHTPRAWPSCWMT
jgi:transcriptional regulator with GAF, ATPase, and Fis domain